MSYVYALDPQHHGYQIINENDFEEVFREIGKLVNDKPLTPFEEGIEITKKASVQANTKDTSIGTSFDPSDFDPIFAKH